MIETDVLETQSWMPTAAKDEPARKRQASSGERMHPFLIYMKRWIERQPEANEKPKADESRMKSGRRMGTKAGGEWEAKADESRM